MFGFGIKVPQISVEEIKKMLDKGENPTIIDVRTPQEFERAIIPGSINIPLNKINSISQKISDKTTKTYVYCLSGSRSQIAAEQLIKMGYINTYNIKSGLLAWRAKQYALT